MAKKEWCTYEEAMQWGRDNNIKSSSQWRARSNEENFPANMPRFPDSAFKSVFPGWGEFLGTGVIAPQNKVFRPFQEARAWAQQQNIPNQKAWQALAKEPSFPSDLPANPAAIYKNDFEGYGDWLGTGAVAAQKRIYRSMDDATIYALQHKLTTKEEWIAHAKTSGFPKDLPADPRKGYSEEFPGWPLFLRSGRLSNMARTFMTCEDAGKWAQGEGIKTKMEWRERTRQGSFPTNVPKNPEVTYGVDFPGWGEFLATGNVANHQRNFVNYVEAVKWAQAANITSFKEWRKRNQEPGFPKNIPTNPHGFYGDEFKQGGGWLGFLGQVKLSGRSKIEIAIKQVLGLIFDLDPARRAIIQHPSGGRDLAVDIVDHERRLVIEYDGSFWHATDKKHESDRRKTLLLTNANPPWSVIRVREAPLELLNPGWDVQVPPPDGAYGPTINAVLQHLRALTVQGKLVDHGLVEDIDLALASPIDEKQFAALFQIGWRSSDEAATWAQQENITTHKEWRERCKQPNFPEDIPQYPDEAYGSAFPGWGEFLATGRIAAKDRQFCSYEECKQRAQARGLKGEKEWREWSKSEDFPIDMPTNPHRTYKGEFEGWGVFLGTHRIAHQHRQYRTYEDAALWARSTGIKTEAEWRIYRKNPDFPMDIPKNPERTYGKDFKGWAHFLRGEEHQVKKEAAVSLVKTMPSLDKMVSRLKTSSPTLPIEPLTADVVKKQTL